LRNNGRTSQIYLYFTTASDDEALKIVTSTNPPIHQNAQLDRSDQRGIEPIVNLGQLIANILGMGWDPDMIEDTNIYPPGPEPTIEEWMEGLPENSLWNAGVHCNRLKNSVSDALSGIQDDRITELAQTWSQIEEWHENADLQALQQTIRDLASLSKRARAAGQSLYVYYSV